MAIIHDYDIESGDLTGLTQSGSDISAASGAALASTDYGLSVVVDDTTTNYVYNASNPGAQTTGRARARFYIDPNSITIGSGTAIVVFALRYSVNGWNLAVVQLVKTGTTYYIQAYIYNDSGSPLGLSSYSITDAPHYVEFDLIRATNSTSNDGSLQLWIDGVSKETYTGVDNYDRFANWEYFRWGAITKDASQSGTFYLDELIVNNDGSEIGPLSGTEYTQAVSGAVTPAGEVVKRAAKIVAGSITPAGEVVKRAAKIVAGSITPTNLANFSRSALVLLSGELTSAGTVVKRAGKGISGALVPAGAVINRAGKSLAGAITPAGVVLKRAGKLMAGSITPSGVVGTVKAALMSLAGSLTPAGTVVLRTGKSLAGSITPDGALVRSVRKILSGGLTPAGDLIRTTLKVLAGALTSAGDVIASKLTGTVYYQAVAGALEPVGDLMRRAGKVLSGAITPDGALSRMAGKIVCGALALAGEVASLIPGAVSRGSVVGSETLRGGLTGSEAVVGDVVGTDE